MFSHASIPLPVSAFSVHKGGWRILHWPYNQIMIGMPSPDHLAFPDDDCPGITERAKLSLVLDLDLLLSYHRL